jgi:hypothetical protein
MNLEELKLPIISSNLSNYINQQYKFNKKSNYV